MKARQYVTAETLTNRGTELRRRLLRSRGTEKGRPNRSAQIICEELVSNNAKNNLVSVQRSSAGHHVNLASYILENCLMLSKRCFLLLGTLALGGNRIEMLGS